MQKNENVIIKNKKFELYRMVLKLFRTKYFQLFVKFVNQILIFHVDKQLILNDDVLNEIIFVYNHLN